MVGAEALQKMLRDNPVADEFRHHLLLARLAVQARLMGARVEIDPPKPAGGPGDLRLIHGDADLFLEVKGLGPAKAFIRSQAEHDAAVRHLADLDVRHGVRWGGQLPTETTAAWQADTERAALETATDQVARDVLTDGGALTVHHAESSPPLQLSSRDIYVSDGARLQNAVETKARQAAAAGAAWVWLADAGALWPLTQFASAAPADKVAVLARLLDGVFTAYPHLLGVIVTSDELRLYGPVADETAQGMSGTATRRTLPGGLVRDSIVVHRRLLAPAQYGLAVRLCAEEPTWLDGALRRLGVPGGLASLLT